MSSEPPRKLSVTEPSLDATIVTDDSAAQTQPDVNAEPDSKPNPADKLAVRKETTRISQLGDFKLIKKLGQGGMGEVFLARQISLDRDVALKLLSKKLSSKQNFVERFVKEARLMARLDHPNIVRGYVVGEDQGLHYVAMELIDGKSMQDWQKKLGKLSVGDALHITIRVADALRHAHEINLVHRDIKPDNMLVTSKGVLKVSDLGLAKDLEEDKGMTQSGVGLGTPYYMAPEQARNAKHVDGRCDIYALGSTLYHFLAGTYPYKADSTVELLLMKETKPFTPIRRLAPEIPERLSLIIDKMMARDPKHRYQNCEELLKDLHSLNLASPTLSFIAGAVPSRVSLPTPPTEPATPKLPATSVGSTPAARKGPSGEQVWFVKHTNDKGRLVVAKLSTPQVLQILKAGQLDVKAKASKTGKDDYLPLMQFREFEAAVQQNLVKAKADKTAGRFEGIYKDIEADVLRRKRWGWIRGYTQNVTGFLGLLLWLVVIACLLGGCYWLVVKLMWPAIAVQYKLI